MLTFGKTTIKLRDLASQQGNYKHTVIYVTVSFASIVS